MTNAEISALSDDVRYSITLTRSIRDINNRLLRPGKHDITMTGALLKVVAARNIEGSIDTAVEAS